MSNRLFALLVATATLMFVGAPMMIGRAPYVDPRTMDPVAHKIFYFHVPAWFAMFLSIFVCGAASFLHLLKDRPAADRLAVASAEVAILFGLIGLTTGPLWAWKEWGHPWVWDVRLTMAAILELIFVAYMLLRVYGGPGADKLAGGLALFGTANVPFLYVSVNVWEGQHPKTSVVPTLTAGMLEAFWFCVAAFLLLSAVLIAARMRLEEIRAELDRLHLAMEDS